MASCKGDAQDVLELFQQRGWSVQQETICDKLCKQRTVLQKRNCQAFLQKVLTGWTLNAVF